MAKTKNVMWIMADQLRWDYLSCYGHPRLHTPNIDRIAERGVRFDRAYVQSPICGPSRMSFYTGRYTRSHGATWNGFPLRVGEMTLGDHLRPLGVRAALVGKTHMIPDAEGMARLGIAPDSIIGARVGECGFEPWERDDGIHPDGFEKAPPDYDDYLRAHGMGGANPWEDWANSAEGPDGELLSGWLLENSHLPARVPAEHSETAYMTTRAIEFMQDAGDGPWLCHLSYIKPHWPYLAPAPYNDMYTVDDMLPPNRSAAEFDDGHPLMQAWRDMRVSRSFARDEVRERVGPAYMGLIRQLDDELGRLFAAMEAMGRMEDTMIVISSDHGDNMGDHWLGEKDLFYDCSARVPLIICDPSAEADATRGAVNGELVEGIDLAATFVDLYGGAPRPHILEGRSLMPWLRGETPEWRDYAFAEYDYATRDARRAAGVGQEDARLVMVFDGRWKMTHANGFRPILFDLETDPGELVDRGADPACAAVIARLQDALHDWALRHHNRVTRTPAQIERMTDGKEPPGILIGYWDQDELDAEGVPLRRPNIY